MSVKSIWTDTVSFAPREPCKPMMYCGVDPSSSTVGPEIVQVAGPSGAPSGPWVSSIVVVTSSAAASMMTAAPVDVVAFDNASVNSSGPSPNASSVIPTLMTKSDNVAPSTGAVYVSVPVAELKTTSGFALAATVIAATMLA